jgi:hypothetical protein
VKPFYFIIFILLGFITLFNVYAGTDIKSLHLNVTVSCPSCTPTPTPTPSETPTPTPTSQPGGGGGGAAATPVTPKAAVVEFKGLAYPWAAVSVLRDGQLIGTVTADVNGLFSFTDSGLAGGPYSFGFIATDGEGRKSIILSFILDVVPQSTTGVAGIIIPPTVSVDKEEVLVGEMLSVKGQAAPDSDISVEILPEELTYQAKAQSSGIFLLEISTADLKTGVHTVRVKEKLADGRESIFSGAVGFGLGVPYKERRFEIPGRGMVKAPDFNVDGRVNIIDLSIMLFWFKKTIPTGFFADLNRDGIVDITDFSILAFYWTG